MVCLMVDALTVYNVRMGILHVLTIFVDVLMDTQMSIVNALLVGLSECVDGNWACTVKHL